MMQPISEMQEKLGTDSIIWEIGPYHGALPAPMKLKLELDGESIVSADVETGFLHRGLEKAFEQHSWKASTVLADRLDPDNTIFSELAFCLAVEQFSEIQVSDRALAIRLIMCELGRVSAHLGYVFRVARVVSSETMAHYVLRDRERVLDLFELLTGARFSINFLRLGGVSADVTEGFLERVLETCDLLRVRLKEYNDLFTFSHSFLNRTRRVGVIDLGLVRQNGLTGPNARASGFGFDVRKVSPYCGYDQHDFDIPLGSIKSEEQGLDASGDAHDRFVLRLKEISQSISLLEHAVESMPAGDFGSSVDLSTAVVAGEAYSRVESARGLLGCYVVSEGGPCPARVQYRTPSSAVVSILPALLSGIRIEDLPVVLASLDLGIAEVDR